MVPPHLPTRTRTSCLKKEERFQDKSKPVIVIPPAFISVLAERSRVLV